jgi:hypothetical protein
MWARQRQAKIFDKTLEFAKIGRSEFEACNIAIGKRQSGPVVSTTVGSATSKTLEMRLKGGERINRLIVEEGGSSPNQRGVEGLVCFRELSIVK